MLSKYALPLLILFVSISSSAETLNFKPLETIPIQHGGRIKPFDTFSREVVQLITGKQTFQGMNAVEMVWSWIYSPEKWVQTPLIEITSLEVKQTFGLPKEQRHFTALQIQALPQFSQFSQAVHLKNQAEEKLSPFEQSIDRLSSQLFILDRTLSGEFVTLIPPYEQGETAPWIPLSALASSDIDKIYADPASQVKISELKMTFQGMSESYLQKDPKTFSLTSLKFRQLLSELPKESGYPYVGTLSSEVFYNHFHPFRKAWILYVVSLIFFITFFIFKKKYIDTIGIATSVLAFLLHVFGFYLRCVITGRAPVGTMYESVVWVSLGAVFFSFILFYSYKNLIIVTAASTVSAIGLILADNLPMVLDSTIRPLAPVLRSNFWLTTHVLIITLSYAAFALAMGLGNWAIFKFMKYKNHEKEIKQLVQFIYRSIQIGVLLLAAGTILGGVWADYSWGRFWGWDPKEVWALIALLLYLAVIHGKYAGWLKDFGIVAASILAFQGVLMAWDGVNFVLGVGLHSYGFGSGGLNYVLSYVTLEIGLICFAFLQYREKGHERR